MNQEEIAKYRILAEQNRRLRRENEALKAENQRLRQQETAASRAFDAENSDMFLLIHQRHVSTETRFETFCFK